MPLLQPFRLFIPFSQAQKYANKTTCLFAFCMTLFLHACLFCILPISGLCFYFCYGIHHSVESRRYACQTPEEEVVLLQPLPDQPMNKELVNGQVRNEQNIGYQRYHETK